jgi:hypothetical protein
MKTRMVSFTDEMVRAMLDGRKDVTRRPLKQAQGPSLDVDCNGKGIATLSWLHGDGPGYPVEETIKRVTCPLGQPGDQILVRERARVIEGVVLNGELTTVRLRYEADGAVSMWMPWPSRLRPVPVGKCIPNGVFVEGARLRREIVSVRVERVQDITEEDAKREGIKRDDWGVYLGGIFRLNDGRRVHERCATNRQAFASLWTSIYGESWTRNDWVWRVEFKQAT